MLSSSNLDLLHERDDNNESMVLDSRMYESIVLVSRKYKSMVFDFGNRLNKFLAIYPCYIGSCPINI